LTAEFLKESEARGMIGLKGYRTVGGIRASIYNAMPIEGCAALAELLRDFAELRGP
jgi:phosphoserine aminotransferase